MNSLNALLPKVLKIYSLYRASFHFCSSQRSAEAA